MDDIARFGAYLSDENIPPEHRQFLPPGYDPNSLSIYHNYW